MAWCSTRSGKRGFPAASRSELVYRGAMVEVDRSALQALATDTRRSFGMRGALFVSLVAGTAAVSPSAFGQEPPSTNAAAADGPAETRDPPAGTTGGASGVTTGPQLEATVAGAPEPAPRAEDRAPADPTMRKVVAERRNGLVLGVSPGFGLAASSGYPNDPKFIGNEAYYSSTPMLAGHATSFFLMGAFTDWVSFGPMVNVATFENDTWKSTGFGVGFRLETFPLLRLFPTLADTSVYSQLGFGSAALRAKLDVPDSDGSQSFLGVGIHHEFRLARLLGGHAAIGPFVEYDAIFAKPIERHWLSVGVRIAWYGGKVTADRR